MVKKKVETEEVKTPAAVSQEKAALEALIAVYKEQNPAKYEAKKEALEARLAALTK